MGKETVLNSEEQRPWASLVLKPDAASRCAPDMGEWPSQLRGDLCWDSNTFGRDPDVALTLSPAEISEVRDAVAHFNDLGRYGSEVTSEDFPLPTLGPRLLRAAVDVHRGKGFALIRGLRPDMFSIEDNVLVFLGISSYIGGQRGRQDEDGNMLMHIRDSKLSNTPQEERPTRYSSRASTFHTDTFCDILALQTRNNAESGGRNILSSAWTIYNKLAASHPRVLELLAQPAWPFDSRGELFKCTTRPLLYYHEGRVMMNFAREPLLGLPNVKRTAGLGELSQAQREALDLVEEMAKQNQIVLDAEPGDMLFINNHAVLHSREAFVDDIKSPRYLVRMWLKNPALAWSLPRPLQVGNSRIYEDNELGEMWNIVDSPKSSFTIRDRLTS